MITYYDKIEQLHKSIYSKLDSNIWDLLQSRLIVNIELVLLMVQPLLTSKELLFFCREYISFGIDKKDKQYLIDNLYSILPEILVIVSEYNTIDFDQNLLKTVKNILNMKYIYSPFLGVLTLQHIIHRDIKINIDYLFILINNSQIDWKLFSLYFTRFKVEFTDSQWIHLTNQLRGKIPVYFYSFIVTAIENLNIGKKPFLFLFLRGLSEKYYEKLLIHFKYSSYSRKNIRKLKEIRLQVLQKEKNYKNRHLKPHFYPSNHSGKSKRRVWREIAVVEKPKEVGFNSNNYYRNGKYIIYLP